MHVLLRGDIVQKFRLGSGLILFTFAATHFLNHAVGLVHIESMHELQSWRLVVTRSIVGTDHPRPPHSSSTSRSRSTRLRRAPRCACRPGK